MENHETPGAEYPNANDSEDTETNRTSALPNFMPQILPDDEIAKAINPVMVNQCTYQKHCFIILWTLRTNSSSTWSYRNISSKYRWNHHSFWSCNQTRKKVTWDKRQI